MTLATGWSRRIAVVHGWRESAHASLVCGRSPAEPLVSGPRSRGTTEKGHRQSHQHRHLHARIATTWNGPDAQGHHHRPARLPGVRLLQSLARHRWCCKGLSGCVGARLCDAEKLQGVRAQTVAQRLLRALTWEGVFERHELAVSAASCPTGPGDRASEGSGRAATTVAVARPGTPGQPFDALTTARRPATNRTTAMRRQPPAVTPFRATCLVACVKKGKGRPATSGSTGTIAPRDRTYLPHTCAPQPALHCHCRRRAGPDERDGWALRLGPNRGAAAGHGSLGPTAGARCLSTTSHSPGANGGSHSQPRGRHRTAPPVHRRQDHHRSARAGPLRRQHRGRSAAAPARRDGAGPARPRRPAAHARAGCGLHAVPDRRPARATGVQHGVADTRPDRAHRDPARAHRRDRRTGHRRHHQHHHARRLQAPHQRPAPGLRLRRRAVVAGLELDAQRQCGRHDLHAVGVAVPAPAHVGKTRCTPP